MKKSLKRLVTGISVIGLGASVALPSMAQSKFTPNAETTPANTSTTPANNPTTPPPSNRDAGIPPIRGQAGQNTPGTMTNPDSSINNGTTTNPALPNNQSVPGVVAPANRPEVNNVPTNGSPTGATPTNTTNYAFTGSSNQSIDQIVRTSPSFELFNALLRVADANGAFSSELAGDSNVTIFAPTDEALAAIPAATFKALVQPENHDLLVRVLQNHIVKGKVSSSDLATKQVQSMAGSSISAQGGNGSLMIGNAQVIGPDIQASNGIIHAVNQVILPAELQGKLTSLAPQGSMPMTQP